MTLPVQLQGEDWTIGGVHFAGVPAKTELRVTYKAEPVMPNLPSKMQRAFARGPVDGRTGPIPKEEPEA